MLALPTRSVICRDGARSLLMVTPRSRYDDTTGIRELLTLNVTLNVPGEDFLPITSEPHLSMEIESCHISSDETRAVNAVCSSLMSS